MDMPSSSDFEAVIPPMPRGPFALWAGRIGLAPPVLVLAFLLPAPHNHAIGGLPSLCVFHNVTGYPCPGCGMTRSVVAFAHGLWAQSIFYHPLGPIAFAIIAGLTSYHFAKLLRPQWQPNIPPRFKYWSGSLAVAALMVVWLARIGGFLHSPP